MNFTAISHRLDAIITHLKLEKKCYISLCPKGLYLTQNKEQASSLEVLKAYYKYLNKASSDLKVKYRRVYQIQKKRLFPKSSLSTSSFRTFRVGYKARLAEMLQPKSTINLDSKEYKDQLDVNEIVKDNRVYIYNLIKKISDVFYNVCSLSKPNPNCIEVRITIAFKSYLIDFLESIEPRDQANYLEAVRDGLVDVKEGRSSFNVDLKNEAEFLSFKIFQTVVSDFIKSIEEENNIYPN